MIKPIIQEKILYPELLWHKGVNIYKQKGRILLIGGERNPKETIRFCETIYYFQIGKLTLVFPNTLSKFYQQFIPPEILSPVPATSNNTFSPSSFNQIKNLIDTHDLMVIGVGLSLTPETETLISKLQQFNFPLFAVKRGIASQLKTIRKLPAFNFLELTRKDYPILEAERLIAEYLNPVVALTKDGSLVVKDNKIVVTHFNPKNAEIILAALTVAIWSFNIKKLFESACVASYLTKKWSETNQQMKNITQVIRQAEREIEKGAA